MAWARKRFYRSAAVEAAPSGFRVTLDGRPVRTPAGADLVVPSAALGRAVAEEWLAQADEIRPHTMPATQLAVTAIDRVGRSRDSVVGHLVAYGGSDLLCYRADHPDELVARQHACWQPLLDWVAAAWRAELVVTQGVMPVDQPPGAVDALRRAVSALDDLELAVLGSVVPACGSLVLGLAILAGRITPEAAFEAAQLDESFQIERWGEDEELTERRSVLRREIAAAAAFLAGLRDRAELASDD